MAAPAGGADSVIEIEGDDGSVTISFGDEGAPVAADGGGAFGDNIWHLAPANTAEDLLTAIDADRASRQEWIDQRDQGLKLLGLKIEEPRGDVGNSSAPLEGMSTVRAPLLLEACLKFQANARGELLPAAGPVKVDNTSGASTAGDTLAGRLEDALNKYLTQTASEYYPDTDRMLFYVGFCGSGFKKLYHCPLRRRPVSESVDATDLIMNAAATDLRNARRVTHRLQMRDSMVLRMQRLKVYRDITLGEAQTTLNVDQAGDDDLRGASATVERPEDADRVIYEVLCELDLGEDPDQMPLPYKVVIDESSRIILAVYRNWSEDDPNRMPRMMYVRYPYIEALGIYALGLLQLVGNTSKAMTAALREGLDAGMFASFPGFLYSEAVGRQETNEFRVPPGGGRRINVASSSGDINKAVMPLPYKDVTPGLINIMKMCLDMGQKLAGTAELPTGEGIQNAPVGTVMAIIDQQTKVMDAVHKRLHAAQGEEFRMLAQLFREDPDALWRHNSKLESGWDRETFIQALDDYMLAPVADPNMPSRTHRIMQTQALIALAEKEPTAFNLRAIRIRALRMLGIGNPEEYLAAADAPPPQDPKAEIERAKLDIERARQQQEGASAQLQAQTEANKMRTDMAKAELVARTDQEAMATERAVEQAKLQLEEKRLGADIATDPAVVDGANRALGLTAPPPASAAGPSGGIV